MKSFIGTYKLLSTSPIICSFSSPYSLLDPLNMRVMKNPLQDLKRMPI